VPVVDAESWQPFSRSDSTFLIDKMSFSAISLFASATR
jgi:hypothetical protein